MDMLRWFRTPVQIKLPAALVILCTTVLLVCGSGAIAKVPYESYIYDYWLQSIQTPQAYVPQRVIGSRDLGLDSLKSPQDLCISHDGNIYLLDTGNNRIIVTDRSFNVIRIINQFDNDGRTDKFNTPQGLFVTDDGAIYVADTGNGRIVELTTDGHLRRIVGAPKSDTEGIMSQDFVYRPAKVAVDPTGRIYALVENEYEGLLAFTAQGEFTGFVGAPRVVPSLADVFWQRIATREQRERLSLFLPTEYTNLDIDYKGLVLAVEANKIRRLNPAGLDVLVRVDSAPPQGDARYPGQWDRGGQYADRATYTGPSAFSDVTAGRHGMYSILDGKRGRVFTYDRTGRLLFVFGGPGSQTGLFTSAVALDMLGDDVLVLDRSIGTITVFRPTIYGKAILSAIDLYEVGLYEQSTEMWQRVLKLNSNYDMAYTGIGRALLRQEQYVQAMEYFRLGNDREGYSEAFTWARKDAISARFGFAVAVLALLAVALFALKRWTQRLRSKRAATANPADGALLSAQGGAGAGNPVRRWLSSLCRELRYGLYIATKPSDGFWGLKHERRGSVAAATIILLLVTATYIFMRQYTGFVFNHRDPVKINIYTEAASVLLPFGLWCVVNWSLTTLMDGKGSIEQIYIASAYALVPLILVNVPLTAVSNFLTIEEGAFYTLLLTAGLAWAMLLLFIGTMVTHDYSASRGALTVALTVFGMGIVLFISLLFVILANQLVSFITDIYMEVTFRM